MQGYEALRTRAAWMDLSARGKIKVTGEDRARLLHAMTTNHVEEMQPGDAKYAFFLNPQGRILADVWILCFDGYFLLITEPETRQKVFDHLDRFIIADDAYMEDVTDQWALISVEGPEAGPQPLPITYTGLPGGSTLIPADGKAAHIASLVQLVHEQADMTAARTVRIETGKPRYGEELTDRFLVQETGQLHAVHFTKGCYVGQEIVERVRSRGQVHRHLSAVRIAGADVPAGGSKLSAEGKDLGELVSAVYSPGLGEVAGMAYLRTEAAKPGFELTFDNRRVLVVRV